MILYNRAICFNESIGQTKIFEFSAINCQEPYI